MFKKIIPIIIFSFVFVCPVLAAVTPSDSFYNQQWYLPKIKADQAWQKINSSPNITIAIIDSGIQVDHPDLKDNIWRNNDEIPSNGKDDDRNGFIDDVVGWDFIDNSPDPSPKFEEGFNEAGISHGTMVAGIAAASGNNNKGVAGVTWGAKIMPLRVLDDSGEGKMSDVTRAIDYAINNGADIINFSFVGFARSEALEKAIEKAYRNGVIVVAAAGNEQSAGTGYNTDETPIYPASHDGPNGENWVLGVAATDALDQKADFSSYGFQHVDISAPGVRIFNTVTYKPNIANNQFNVMYDGYWSGTSMATPLVSGALALIEEINPTLNRQEVVDILLGSADNISRLNPDYLGQLGTGRLNVNNAVNQAYVKLFEKSGRIVTIPASQEISLASINNRSGETLSQIQAYGDNFLGGANVAAGDIDGDGQEELIFGAGFGGGPHVRVFDHRGNLKLQFFAYDSNFRGGVNVAAGDVDGDGKDEIITGAGFGGGPNVVVFDGKGKIKFRFFAYNSSFSGGVNVAAGDVDGDGLEEIVTGAGLGGGPQVRIFNEVGLVEGQFFAYPQNFRGGVKVAVANIDGRYDRNHWEIVTAPGPGIEPEVKIFDHHASIKRKFMAYDTKFQKGFSISAGDINNDGLDEIVTGAGPGGGPHIRTFNGEGALQDSFYALDSKFSGGVNVGIIQINN